MLGVSREPRLTRRWRAALPDHVVALAWSPDDRLVAAAAATGPVGVLDADPGAVRHMLPGHGFGATSVAWADAGTVASSGQDGRARLWDAATGAERRSLDAGVTQVVWSGGDARVAVGTEGGEVAVYGT